MPHNPFPQTRWTLILSAKKGESDDSLEAIKELSMAYWNPIYTYARSRGHSHEEAQDATQGFFAYLLGRDFLQNIEPEGGRFRNFLLVALRRWMKDERKRVRNVKRDAETRLESWHELEASESIPYPNALSPEEAFDRSWAAALIHRSMEAVKERWKNRPELFRALSLTVEDPDNVEKHASIAKRLGMSEGAVNKAAYDLRRQFSIQIKKEVRDTVARDEDVEEELRYLVRLSQR